MEDVDSTTFSPFPCSSLRRTLDDEELDDEEGSSFFRIVTQYSFKGTFLIELSTGCERCGVYGNLLCCDHL